MSGSLTFSGTPGASYSAPSGYSYFTGSFNIAPTGDAVIAPSSGSFIQFIDNDVLSGSSCSVETTMDWNSATATNEAGLCCIDSSGNGWSLIMQGTAMKLRQEGGSFSDLATTTRTISGVTVIKADFNQSTGAISIKQDGVEFLTHTFTGSLTGLRFGLQHYRDASEGQRYRTMVTVTGGAESLTIDSTPTNNRVTESRTIRVTAPATAITTGNTTIKINNSGNAAITPSSVTVVTGLTVDIAYTVPDTYAGLPYSATGYPVIVTTADGTVSSGNVPFLPVTGNDFVTATAVPGDFSATSGSLAIGDQIEYETLGGDVSVSSILEVTYSGADPTGLSFDARAWDDTDDTWGAWAAISLDDALAFDGAFQADAFQSDAFQVDSGSYTINAESGSFAVTGGNLNLIASRLIAAESGSVAVTGGDLNFIIGRKIACDSGSFAITGGDASILVSRRIAADSGSYSVAGQDLSILASRKITAESGGYSITGGDMDFVYTPSGSYSFVCDSGSFAVTGSDLSIRVSRLIQIGSGSIAVTGQDLGIIASRRMQLDSGAYALSGQDAAIRVSRLISLGSGSFAVSGGDIGIIRSLRMGLDAGVYGITGYDMTFNYSGDYTIPTDFFANCIVRVQSDIIVATETPPSARLKRDPIVQVKYGL